MPGIAVITDTDSSIPFDLAAQYNIHQVPVTIHFGEESYEAVYALSDADTFRRIDQAGQLPTTAAPSPGKFIEAYKNAFSSGVEKIVCLCVSSEMSATYSAALSACELFPGREIRVIDSRSLSMGLGYMALAAAEAASQGASMADIAQVIEETRQRTHLYAALSTLKYMAMGGRVTNLTAAFASMLNVKPILTIRDGKLDLLERVRTQKKAWERVIELSAIQVGNQQIEKMSILHVNAPKMANEFKLEIQSRMHCPSEILSVEVTPGLSVHSGAGMVGTVFVVK
ncbi:MAG TPA: DegV family protein [Anaerolineales bacterium]|nr:DegV family protein [Anaerolineales bacterium]